MREIVHKSADNLHYDQQAEHYDVFNEESTVVINEYLAELFSAHKARKILDLTCGTGSQVFWLHQRGFDITGVDINRKMLAIAQEKATTAGLTMPFIEGDMRTQRVGEFDAVITIFNAIGHLTKPDFIKAIQNIHANLKSQGLYVFDIFNLSYLLSGDNITKLTIDWQKQYDDTTVREIQYSTISTQGVLASYDIFHVQQDHEKPKISQEFQTLQVYSRGQLKAMLEANGFEVIQQCNVDGTRLHETQTERIMTVARKQ